MKLSNIFLSEHKYKYVLIFLFSILTLAGNMIIPIIISEIITCLVSYNLKHLLIKLCISFLLVSALIQMIKYLNSILTLKTYLSINKKFFLYFYDEFYQYDLKDISSQNKNIVAQTITNDTSKVINFYLGDGLSLIINILSCLFMVVLLYNKSPLFVLLLIVFTLFQIFFYRVVKDKILHFNVVGVKKRNLFYSYLVQTYELLKFIKINSLMDNLKSGMSDKFDDYSNISLQKEKFSWRIDFLEQLVYLIIQVLVFVVAIEQISSGRLAIGDFTLCYTYFNIISGSLKSFLSFGKKYQDYKAAYERLKSILNKNKVIHGNRLIEKIESIGIKNFQFTFDDSQYINYDDMEFKKGTVYGIVGKNGAGKSTLINNVLGLHSNTGVYINGVPLEKLDMEHIRKNLISVCEQECTISNETIYYNLTFTKNFDEKTVSKISEYLGYFNYKIDDIYDFLNKELNNTFLNLSLGEKQKLSIIRVLLEDGDVMIFDEPTASLDSHSFDKFMQLVSNVKQDKIIMIISHDDRLKTICDTIYAI